MPASLRARNRVSERRRRPYTRQARAYGRSARPAGVGREVRISFSPKTMENKALFFFLQNKKDERKPDTRFRTRHTYKAARPY